MHAIAEAACRAAPVSEQPGISSLSDPGLLQIQTRTPGVRDSWLGGQLNTRTRGAQMQQANILPLAGKG